MQFEIAFQGDHIKVFEFEAPKGSLGLELFRECAAIAAEIGWAERSSALRAAGADQTAGMNSLILAFVNAKNAERHVKRLFETSKLKMDGEVATVVSLSETGGYTLPYVICARLWSELGFLAL